MRLPGGARSCTANRLLRCCSPTIRGASLYSINPARLDAHAAAFVTDSETTSSACSYTTQHVTLEFLDTSFLYAKALDAANKTSDALTAYFDHLRTALEASATELTGTATRSRELDDALERELDATYPGTVSSGEDLTPPDAGRSAPRAPGDELTPPATQMPEDLVATILTTDWLSPSSVLAQVLDWIFDWNYLDVISKNFSGDWNRLYEVSDALTRLGAYTSAHGENVRHEMAVTAASWTGEAATAANAFFTTMARNLEETGTQITELGPSFEAVARGMKSTANLVSGIFSQIMDAALIAAVCIAAGTVTIETVVGGILGYICGGAEIVYAVWLAHSAYETVQSALQFFDGLGAAVGLLGSFLAGDAQLPIPTAYDNEQVA